MLITQFVATILIARDSVTVLMNYFQDIQLILLLRDHTALLIDRINNYHFFALLILAVRLVTTLLITSIQRANVGLSTVILGY